MRWLSALLVLCGGCLSAFAPSLPVAPLLDEQGDVSVGGDMRVAGPQRGAQGFIAAAPTEHSRAYVAGSFSHDVGSRMTGDFDRKLKERSDSKRIEGGAGGGFAYRKLIVEGLAGMAYARTRGAHCDQELFPEYHDECGLWVDGRARYISGFVQGEAAARFNYWVGGGGVRIAVAHFRFSQLFDRPSQRETWLPTFEPFIVQRVGYPWGRVELGLYWPFVLHSARARDHDLKDPKNSYTDRLFYQPGPRLMLGLVFNIDELWRRR